MKLRAIELRKDNGKPFLSKIFVDLISVLLKIMVFFGGMNKQLQMS